MITFDRVAVDLSAALCVHVSPFDAEQIAEDVARRTAHAKQTAENMRAALAKIVDDARADGPAPRNRFERRRAMSRRWRG